MPDDSPEKDLSLPANVSEWLFHQALWEILNKNHGTTFEQYEEEVLPAALLPATIDSIEKLLKELKNVPTDRVNFAYAMDHNRAPLNCEIPKAELENGIAALREFLNKAHTSRADVYCQL